MQKSIPRLRGFTLIEALISIAILATLLTLAAPSWAGLFGRSQVGVARNALHAALSEARIAAVMRAAPVVVCPSFDQDACTRSSQWQVGWIAFVDLDHDMERDEDEPVLVVGQSSPAGVAVLGSSGRPRIRFQPDGSASGTNLSLTVCERASGSKAASQLVVSNAGRVRTGAPSPAQAAACLAAAG